MLLVETYTTNLKRKETITNLFGYVSPTVRKRDALKNKQSQKNLKINLINIESNSNVFSVEKKQSTFKQDLFQFKNISSI